MNFNGALDINVAGGIIGVLLIRYLKIPHNLDDTIDKMIKDSFSLVCMMQTLSMTIKGREKVHCFVRCDNHSSTYNFHWVYSFI